MAHCPRRVTGDLMTCTVQHAHLGAMLTSSDDAALVFAKMGTRRDSDSLSREFLDASDCAIGYGGIGGQFHRSIPR
jgi:hypothetical protein